MLLQPALAKFEALLPQNDIWRDLNVGAHDDKFIPVPSRGCRESTEKLTAHFQDSEGFRMPEGCVPLCTALLARADPVLCFFSAGWLLGFDDRLLGVL